MTSKRWTLLAVILGSGIVFLDSTIVPVALPRIGRELPTLFLDTLEGQSYVYYGYLLSLSAFLVLAGGLTDYYGRRRLFAIGLVGFGVTSALCGLAPNLELLVLGRFLQGIAGAILVPGALSIITATFEGEEQGRAFGVWAGASAAMTILGPLIGGALVASVSWRAAFLINLPLIAVALWATVTHMGETRDEDATGRFDWLGALLIAVAVGGLTFGAIRGQAQEWRDPVAYVCLVAGAVAAVAFVPAMARSQHPLVPLELFRSRNFSVTNISTLLIYGAIYVTFQLAALYLIGVLGYNEVGFGLATIPSDLFLALFSARFGVLAERYGPRVFMAVGPAIMGLALLWFSRIPATSDAWRFDMGTTALPPADVWIDVILTFTIFGIGLMIMVAPLTTTLMRSVPVRHSGVASAFNNAVSRVGPQLAGALLFIAVTSSFFASLDAQLPGGGISEALRERVSPLNAVEGNVQEGVATAARVASTDAFHLATLVAALMCFAGALVNAVGIRNVAREAEKAGREPVTPCPESPPVERPAPQRG
jgi:EmrB/QacA subfamily drug resistance transporter